jgi:hypothetical protein
MHPGGPCNDVLLLMLADILHEADAIRPHDPVRAGHLDEAANDLMTVIAEDAGGVEQVFAA